MHKVMFWGASLTGSTYFRTVCLLTLEGHGLSQGLLRSRAHDGADEQLIKQVMMTARVCSVGAADGAGRNKSYL